MSNTITCQTWQEWHDSQETLELKSYVYLEWIRAGKPPANELVTPEASQFLTKMSGKILSQTS